MRTLLFLSTVLAILFADHSTAGRGRFCKDSDKDPKSRRHHAWGREDILKLKKEIQKHKPGNRFPFKKIMAFTRRDYKDVRMMVAKYSKNPD